MARAYRSMLAEGEPPRPVVGSSATTLGVREWDLTPDVAGNAVPGLGGMSVISLLAGLRRRVLRRQFGPTMVPQRLHASGRLPGAIGSNTLCMFRIGEGAFEPALLTDRLALAPDRDDHGTIQPAVTMLFSEYAGAIENTRDDWRNGEADDDDEHQPRD